MEKIGFIGMYDKTDMILYLGKILTMLEKKVLFIDATMTQKARYIVPVISPATSYVTEYEEIDIAVGFENFEQIKKYLHTPDEQLPYDIILVDTDNKQTIDSFELYNSEKNYFVTSFDNYSLKKGLEIFLTMNAPMNLTKVIFSQTILKEEDDYLNYLSLGYKIIWEENRIYFPLTTEDINAIYENQRLAKIKFKKLSASYKEGLVYLALESFKNISESQIRRAVKTIERGV